MEKTKKYRNIWMLGFILILIYTYPFLSIADKKSGGSSMPPIFSYLFITWIIAIAILFFTAEMRKTKSDKE